MEGHSNGRKTEGNGPKAERLLRASEYFLRCRNFDDCRKYALSAQESDPHNPRVAQLLAVAAVVAAAETCISNNNRADWYAILQVNRYSNDSQLIKNQFKELILLLNPRQNKFDFASVAFDLVREAWAVLSSPSKKPLFDNELKVFESQSDFKTHNHQEKEEEEEEEEVEGFTEEEEVEGFNGEKEEVEGKCGSVDETFWTVCPYCYYVYEYPRVYVDCCLSCQNQKCRRGFHAVVLPSPPPAEVAENGQYWCVGFFQLGFEGGEQKGFPSWTPFAPFYTGTPKTEAEEKNAVPESANACVTDSYIEISDDSDDGLESENGGTFKNVNTDKAQTEEVKKVSESAYECATSNLAKPEKAQTEGVKKVGESACWCAAKRVETEASNLAKPEKAQTEEVKKVGESAYGCATKRVETEASNLAKPAMKRKKSVARDTKKLMGKGTRIAKQENFPPQSNEELDSDVEASKVDVDFGLDSVERKQMVSGDDFGMDEMEFFEGEDDIFVGVQDGF